MYGKLGISLRREQLRLDGSLRPPMAWLTGRMEALPHQKHVVVKPCRSSGSTGTYVVDTLAQAVDLARVQRDGSARLSGHFRDARQVDLEAAPFARCGGDGDRATVRVHQRVDDRQAEAGAAAGPGA